MNISAGFLRPLAVVLLQVVWLTGSSFGQSFSGMYRVTDDSYLTVHDVKNHKPDPRLGILKVSNENYSFVPLAVEDWKDSEGLPSDLEAVCPVPGRAGEYLVTESGKYQNKFGRMFHIRVLPAAEAGMWTAECLASFRIDRPAPDGDGSTWEGDQIEGMAAMAGFDPSKPIVVFGERGGKLGAGFKVGQLFWGELDLGSYQFVKLGESPLVGTSVLPAGRDCSDLHLESRGGKVEVWSVATRDGGDVGPFQSVVFQAGSFTVDASARQVTFQRAPTPTVLQVLHGLKVEALAASPTAIKDSMLSVATDDEGFGGIWRALYVPSPAESTGSLATMAAADRPATSMAGHATAPAMTPVSEHTPDHLIAPMASYGYAMPVAMPFALPMAPVPVYYSTFLAAPYPATLYYPQRSPMIITPFGPPAWGY